jgi:hypothetical protein
MAAQRSSAATPEGVDMLLLDSEVYKLAILWQFHRHGCKETGTVNIEQSAGGGIGTVSKLTCSCGHVIDITDYYSW